MTIGTAVPSKFELSQAKHHFIQNKSIFETYTVGDFEKEAIAKLDELFESNNFAILVGGSGLYVDAVLKGFDSFPEIEKSVRENIQKQYDEFGIDFLKQKLCELDPEYFNLVKSENPQTLQNPQRMMRFVEVCMGSGKPYSSFLNKEKNKRNFNSVCIGLEGERVKIYDRINQRVDLMMKEGLLLEAEKLFPNKELNALQTVGYRELFQFFEGEISLELAIEEIKKNTRRFSKRQMTWFKKAEKVIWFDFERPKENIINFVASKIHNS